MNVSRGRFISLDGLDGAGKSTQCHRLAEFLREAGLDVVVCRDPGGTVVGDRIRGVLLDPHDDMSLWCEAFLYMASRSQLVQEVIGPALEDGKTVVSDRFLLANVVYQGHAGGLPVDRLWEIGGLATGGILPDLTCVLDVPPEIAVTRRTRPPDRMESRGVEFHARVRAGFLSEAKRTPERVKIIDAARPAEAIQADIQREVVHVVGIHART